MIIKEKMKCPYCHSDGSHLDNASVWGSKPIDNLAGPGYPDLYVDLSTHRLVSGVTPCKTGELDVTQFVGGNLGGTA